MPQVLAEHEMQVESNLWAVMQRGTYRDNTEARYCLGLETRKDKAVYL